MVRKFHLEAAARNCSGAGRVRDPAMPLPSEEIEWEHAGDRDSPGETERMEKGRQTPRKASPLSPFGISAMNFNCLSIMNFEKRHSSIMHYPVHCFSCLGFF